MKHLICLLLLAATPAAAEEPAISGDTWSEDPARWRLALRSGIRWYEDRSIDAVLDEPNHAHGGVTLDFGITPGWWVGLGYQGGGGEGKLHETLATRLDLHELTVGGLYRWRPHPTLALYGRLAGVVGWYDLEIDDPGAPLLDSSAVRPGILGGVGIDFYPLHPSFIPGVSAGGGDFGFGISLELIYQRVWPLELADGGTDLGDLDPSGPGFLMGVTFQF